jgi:hypothetical protein
MKTFFLGLILFTSSLAFGESTISGKVVGQTGCSQKKVMVWLSLDKDHYQERLLLMHTEVPIDGTFSFFVKPGKYQVRGSDPEGCEFFQRVSVKNEDLIVPIKMVKK